MLCLQQRAALHLTKRLANGRAQRVYSNTVQQRLSDVLKNTQSGDIVTVHGFVQSIRKQKKVAFAALSDGSSIEPLQVVLTPDQAEGYVSLLTYLSRLTKHLSDSRLELE